MPSALVANLYHQYVSVYVIYHSESVCIDPFNVTVFIRATDHVITILCHVTKNCGWQNISGSIDTK